MLRVNTLQNRLFFQITFQIWFRIVTGLQESKIIIVIWFAYLLFLSTILYLYDFNSFDEFYLVITTRE